MFGNRRWKCPAFGGLEIEFLGMEFAKDIVYQTENYVTTQVRDIFYLSVHLCAIYISIIIPSIYPSIVFLYCALAMHLLHH